MSRMRIRKSQKLFTVWKEGNKYEQSKTLICSCAGGIDAVSAYVVLAVKRKRQSYIKKKQREHEKETRTKKEAEQSEFRTARYDMWSRMEPQNEKLMAAMQQLSLKERLVVTEYVLKGKPFKKIAQETGLKEKGVASAYYRSIKKLRAKMGDVK